MKITYIYHSCFVVEFEKIILLFDYYKGELPQFDNEKQIYVFVSHKHQDHFSFSIFSLAEQYEDVTYILSKDIKMSQAYSQRHGISEQAQERIFYIGKDQEEQYGEVKVRTLTSTDEGVAFIIEYKENVLYHAGDLNWWSWQGESEEQFEDMQRRFVNEMEKIEGKEFDVAFLPLDPRQEERFYWGFDYFMRITKTKEAYPMHCWEDYSVIQRLKRMECSREYRERIVDIILS